MENIIVEKVWLTDTEVWIRTTDGKEACEKFSDFQRLKWATPAQRANFTTSHDGIHWRELDEDLSFEGFFRERKSNPLYDLFIAHPELNAAAIARRLGISQSLFAQYVSGTKKPSKKRFEDIIETIRSVGRELMAVPAEVTILYLGVIPFGFTPFLYHFTTIVSLSCITYLIIFHIAY